MTLRTPLWMQAGGGDTEIEYSALLDRTLMSALIRGEGILRPRSSGLKVAQRGAGANFSVDIGAGWCAVIGDDTPDQGTYICFSTGTENVVIPSPPVSGTRIHRVIARVRDKLHDGTQTTYDWVLEVLEDTDGTGPPALPNSAISLAQVSVAAGQASVLDEHITDLRATASLVTSQDSDVTSDAGRPPTPFGGEEIYRSDKGCDEIAVGGTFYEVPRRDGGGSEWSTYTPVLTATSSNPTLGTGSVQQGRYIRYGRMVHVNAIIKFGTSGVNVGSGFYEVSLPVAARTQAFGRRTGSAYLFDSANDYRDGGCFINVNVGDKARLSMNGTVVTPTTPMSFGTADELGITITYEAAS